MSICLPTTNCSDLIWTPSLIFWSDVYSCTGLSFKLKVKGSWTMITKFKLHTYVRFSPLHWFFVCIELEISLGYDFITLSCKQWRWDWLLHYLYHQMCKLSVSTSNSFSIRAISHWNNLPCYVVADFEWFQKNELYKFFVKKWLTLKLDYCTSLLYYYRHCLSFNK